MKSALLVFLGGGIGSVLRYGVSLLFKHQLNLKLDLFGTLTVNILGSLVIGFIMGWLLKSETSNQNLQLLLVVGFCGGFTTFSAFSLENLNLLKSGMYFQFLLYALGSLVIGIHAVYIGFVVMRKLI
ncbi:fluoride efflux transporter CrcB [Psychroflexus tropicus]|uniref:fluoride efflux transporter CrcB n=1 Tax=Psychroflexus tropicus TaxID=197345 RepID=UPI000361895A|nr:fluoride efflux transporter CrcB [Psychroflexus tropicus]